MQFGLYDLITIALTIVMASLRYISIPLNHHHLAISTNFRFNKLNPLMPHDILRPRFDYNSQCLWHRHPQLMFICSQLPFSPNRTHSCVTIGTLRRPWIVCLPVPGCMQPLHKHSVSIISLGCLNKKCSWKPGLDFCMGSCFDVLDERHLLIYFEYVCLRQPVEMKWLIPNGPQ